MDKDKNKGLADDGEGEFILNESGTSVSIDADVDFPEDKTEPDPEEQSHDKTSKETGDK